MGASHPGSHEPLGSGQSGALYWRMADTPFAPSPMRDTSGAAALVQLQALRALSGARRLALAVEMSLAARALLAARLRAEHLGWTEAAIQREVFRLSYAEAVRPDALR